MTGSLFLFFLGFYILIKGADILVRGATSIARILKISSWVIGVVIVGIGTSIPEFSITFISAFNGSKIDIGLGTIIGSNTLNILLILGIAALIRPMQMKEEWVKKDFVINILAVLAAIIFVFLPVLGSMESPGITRPEAAWLFVLFLCWMLYITRARKESADEDGSDSVIMTLPISFLLIVAGLVGVIFGGKWVVDGAETIARAFGASEALIGLTVVGIGTSLPELATSAMAAYRKNYGIAVGNIIGSNIFDFLGILGLAGIFNALPFPEKLVFDIFFTLASATILFVFMFIGEKYILKRWQGLILVALYITYLAMIIQRG